jgi:hypothetical protein
MYQFVLLILIHLNLFKFLEIRRNCYKIPKIVKFVSIFKLEIPLA